MKPTLVAVAACLLAVACSRDEPTADSAVGTQPVRQVDRPATSAVLPSDEVRLPAKWSFPGVDSVEKGDSWDERLARLSHDQRERMETLNARYLGRLAFDTAEEQLELIGAGYPMPEEWLAADAMSDEMLKSLAEAQSPKGTIFYTNRELDRFIESKQQLLDSGRYRDVDPVVFNPKVQAMVYAGNALALTRSPFAAYMYGSVHSVLFGRKESIAAAISVGWSLGDPHAAQMARDFSQSLEWDEGPPLDFGSVAATEATMWQHVHRYRPL